MTTTRKIEQIVPGVPGEYYATFNASAGGDQLVMALEGGGNVTDISVEAIGSTDVDCSLYLYYPCSGMRNTLSSSVFASGSSWSLNQASSKGKMWYRVPSGSILQLYINSVSTAGDIDFLAVVR